MLFDMAEALDFICSFNLDIVKQNKDLKLE